MFRDRKEAGEKLGKALEKYNNLDALVLGIPRGGTETAYYVARHLNAELSVAVTRKLGYPFNPELAFGAVAEDGSVYLSDSATQDLTRDEIEKVLQQQQLEIQRRIQTLRHGKFLPKIKGRTVILVDDGIATGATVFAAIELCKKKGAGKIVVASPVAGKEMEAALRSMVHDVVILETPVFYGAVSEGYENFQNLTDQEAAAFMDDWEKELSVKSGIKQNQRN